jgi:hypothetical protein
MRPPKMLLRRLLLVALATAVMGPGTWAEDGIAGVWEGQYVCAQGVTGLSLFVAPQENGRLRTLFFFYPTADNPHVPEGCFEMSGSYDATTGDAEFVAGRWLLQPPGFVTVDLSAEIDEQAADMSGTVDGPGCADFELRRTAGAHRPFPAACRSPGELIAWLGR